MRLALTRRLANLLADYALRLLPRSRRAWARAMRSELTYLGDREALRWASGCCVAAITLRVHAMMTGDLKISRFILVPEILLCFLPLCLFWHDVTLGDLGLVHLSGPVLHKYFLDTPVDMLFLAQRILAAIIGLLGPIGLLAALWSVLSRRPLKSRLLGAACVAGPVILGLVFFASAISLDANGVWNADNWRGLVLILLVPLAAWHLIHIGLWPGRAPSPPSR